MVAAIQIELCPHCGQSMGAAQVPAYEDGYLAFYPGLKQVWLTCLVDNRRIQVSLTEKETGVLGVLLAHAGEVVSADEITHEVWRNNFDKPKIAQTHIVYLRRKLRLGGRNPISSHHPMSYRYEPLR